MTPRSIIEPYAIEWTPWEERFSHIDREVPVSAKPAAAPIPHAPLNHNGRKINTAAFRPGHIGTVPGRGPYKDIGVCTDPAGHHMRSNGYGSNRQAREKCAHCGRSRMVLR